MTPPLETDMPTRKMPKSLDADPEIAALLARADKKRREHLLTLGAIVNETGAHKVLNADQIKQVLIQARDHAKANPPQQEDQPATPGETFPAKPEKPDAKAKPRPQHHAPEPEGDRTADLLAGAQKT
jgi:hypothetical protein